MRIKYFKHFMGILLGPEALFSFKAEIIAETSVGVVDDRKNEFGKGSSK